VVSAATVADITRKELAALNEREGFQERGLFLTFTPKLVDHLAQEGFSREYGARPLQRTIERLVVAKLADFLLHSIEFFYLTSKNRVQRMTTPQRITAIQSAVFLLSVVLRFF
jgi:ATP-dependent Clp protease ATP-binding subunit ClpA